MRRARLFLYGLCIGAADIVPGVSGGTVAFISGIYEELIASLRRFWRHLDFLLPLGLGMVVAIALFAGVMQQLLAHEIYRTWLYCLFFGLIAASIWFCSKQVVRWRPLYALFLLGGTVAAFLCTTMRPAVESTAGYEVIVSGHELSGVSPATLAAMEAKGIIDRDTPVHREGYTYVLGEVELPAHETGLDGWLVLSGAAAATAMLLPGVSGSYVLTLLGSYPTVIGAIADLVRGDFQGIAVLFSLGIGILIGAALFSRVAGWMLARYHDGAVSILIGLMIGAMPAVWPFWSFTYSLDPLHLSRGEQLKPLAPILPDIDSPVFLVGASLSLIGFLSVMVMERKVSKPPSLIGQMQRKS